MENEINDKNMELDDDDLDSVSGGQDTSRHTICTNCFRVCTGVYCPHCGHLLDYSKEDPFHKRR